MAKKWNFKTHSYEPYEIPKGWICPLVGFDMNELVNCASCGKVMPYGDGFTSRRIHGNGGFGYSVCAECNEKEWADEKKAMEEKEHD